MRVMDQESTSFSFVLLLHIIAADNSVLHPSSRLRFQFYVDTSRTSTTVSSVDPGKSKLPIWKSPFVQTRCTILYLAARQTRAARALFCAIACFPSHTVFSTRSRFHWSAAQACLLPMPPSPPSPTAGNTPCFCPRCASSSGSSARYGEIAPADCRQSR